MMYSPNAVFYGKCDNPENNWSIAFPDGYCEDGKPLLDELVRSKKIRDKAFQLLNDGYKPEEYDHEIYYCSKCEVLSNRFYFLLESDNDDYEPEYKCSKCQVIKTIQN